MSIVDDTWAEIGRKVRPLGRIIFIRTEQLKQTTDGGLYLPASQQTFYDGPMHLRLITAVVLSVGPKVDGTLQPGDRICFQRQFFARWCVLEDRTLVGWIDDSQVAGVCDSDTQVDKFITLMGGASHAPPHPV
jgi:co-chaperonin GroES (HSP10)